MLSQHEHLKVYVPRDSRLALSSALLSYFITVQIASEVRLGVKQVSHSSQNEVSQIEENVLLVRTRYLLYRIYRSAAVKINRIMQAAD